MTTTRLDLSFTEEISRLTFALVWHQPKREDELWFRAIPALKKYDVYMPNDEDMAYYLYMSCGIEHFCWLPVSDTEGILPVISAEGLCNLIAKERNLEAQLVNLKYRRALLNGLIARTWSI